MPPPSTSVERPGTVLVTDKTKRITFAATTAFPIAVRCVLDVIKGGGWTVSMDRNGRFSTFLDRTTFQPSRQQRHGNRCLGGIHYERPRRWLRFFSVRFVCQSPLSRGIPIKSHMHGAGILGHLSPWRLSTISFCTHQKPQNYPILPDPRTAENPLTFVQSFLVFLLSSFWTTSRAGRSTVSRLSHSLATVPRHNSNPLPFSSRTCVYSSIEIAWFLEFKVSDIYARNCNYLRIN